MTHNTWHVTPDMQHLTRDTWHVTPDTWYMTYHMWGGGEQYLKIAAPYLLEFGCNDVLMVWRKRMIKFMNHLIMKVFV